jgi:hypothetical protein
MKTLVIALLLCLLPTVAAAQAPTNIGNYLFFVNGCAAYAPVPTPVKGALCIDVVTGVAYFWNGTAFAQMGGGGIANVSGTWTPSLQFGGATTGITGTFNGNYAQVGKLVNAQFTMTLTNAGTAIGNATLCGLPIPIANFGQGFWTFEDFGGMANITSALQGGVYVAGDPSSCIRLELDNISNSPNNNQMTQMTNGNFTNASQLAGSFTYITQ